MFTPQQSRTETQLARPDCYVVYGWQRSYFTHKLMAALHFYGADWEFRAKTRDNGDEIRLRAATHQIPVLHTPENWMLGDTTPILQMLDHRFAGREMFPGGELGMLVHVLEEYFDEWIARTTVHWRWNYPENHELLSMDAAGGDAAFAKSFVEWGAKVCRATGVSSETQRREAEKEYHRIMQAAEQQLAETRYLLGDRPTAVDCIVLAGLRAHFLFDPAPRTELHDRYPVVVKWVEETADTWDGTGDLPAFPETTGFGRFVLEEMAWTYKPFALGNARALAQKDKAFVIAIYGEDVSYLARPYIEQSRQMIVDHVHGLSTAEEASVRAWLNSVDLLEIVENQP